MITVQEISQFIGCTFQLFQIRQIHNTEMIRLSPVKSFSMSQKHLLLFQKVQDKLLIIQNMKTLCIYFRKNIESRFWLHSRQTGNIIDCLVNIFPLLIDAPSRLQVFLYTLKTAQGCLYNGLCRNIGAETHVGQHIQPFDISLCPLFRPA